MFELKNESKLLKIIHEFLLITGVLTLFYLLYQVVNDYIKSGKSSSFGK